MTRLLPLCLALALAACDAEAPLTPAASDTAAPATLASVTASDEPFAVTESAAVRASGETVLLRVDGQTIEMDAGQAYLIGEALTRAAYDTLPRELQAGVSAARRPGDKCVPPPPGGPVASIGGVLFKRCPPPPPPPVFSFDVYAELLGGGAEITEAPEGADWRSVPGGLIADF